MLLAVGALIVGLFTVITGLFALATAKWKNPCFAAPYMILSFVVSIAALAVAFAILVAPAKKLYFTT